eukprot:CAMPEP_0117435410 /NCGR_PEP_ID=MMETSP0759-20121206/467_1 /TAXON_ID=63605 /ORGANISM="Percolomonas cosmopolitus, Strain WS" /LENGTH=480 /DNA_ID=CAMNT_0005226957 /DNA_START=390 /DNA_END=1832 /DNA_ORIENTATION=+
MRHEWDIINEAKSKWYIYSNVDILNKILTRIKMDNHMLPASGSSMDSSARRGSSMSKLPPLPADDPAAQFLHSEYGSGAGIDSERVSDSTDEHAGIPRHNGEERNYLIRQLLRKNHFPLPADECFQQELELVIRFAYESALAGFDFHRKMSQIQNIYRVERKVEPNQFDPKTGLRVHYYIYAVDRPQWNQQNNVVQLVKGKPDITSNFQYALRTHHIIANKAFLKHHNTEHLRLVMEPPTYPRINFVVPLRNRGKRFLNLLDNLKAIQEFDKKITGSQFRFPRVVVSNMGSEDIDVKEHLKQSGMEYTHIGFHPKAEWSKVVAMESALNVITDPNDLVFILDVDMQMPLDFMHRIRTHTLAGKRVYYPICYSILKSKPASNDDVSSKPNPWHVFHYGGEREHNGATSNGYWRKEGTGMVGAYRYDFDKVQGYNTDKFLNKWGGEDGDLMKRFYSLDYEIVNLPEINYYHIYHEKTWSKGG